MNSFIKLISSTFESNNLLLIIIITLSVAAILTLIITSFEYIYLKGKQNTLRYSFINSIKWIVLISIWTYCFKSIIDSISYVYLNQYFDIITKRTQHLFELSIYIVLIINIFKYLKKSKDIVIRNKKSSSSDNTFDDYRDINAIFKALEILAYIISLLLILAALDVPITALSAFGGVAIAGLTLSQSTLLTNFFGGIFVTFNRKYSDGDMVSSPDFLGTIDSIGLLTSKIVAFDTIPIHVPNSIFLTACISNLSRRTHRRILQSFTINYSDMNKVSTIKDQILTLLKNHKNVDQNNVVSVSLAPADSNVNGKNEGSFGSSGINLQIYALVDKIFYAEFLNVQDEIFMSVADILRKNNVEFAINPISINKSIDNSITE